MYKIAEPKKKKNLPLAKIKMKEISLKKKIKEAKKKKERPDSDPAKALEYNLKMYKEDPSKERFKQLKEMRELYRKKKGK